MSKNPNKVAVRVLYLDDKEEERFNFKYKMDYLRTISDEIDIEYYEVQNFDIDLIAGMINDKDIDIFLCDYNLDDCEINGVPNGLAFLTYLISENLIVRPNVLFVLYTGEKVSKDILDKVKELKNTVYIMKDISGNILPTWSSILKEYKSKFPNNLFKAQSYPKKITGPIDEMYFHFAELLEKDILRSPRQRITIGEKEYNAEMLIDELRKRSIRGEKLVGNYIKALELIRSKRAKGSLNGND
jgi:hypothetical protein